MSPVEQPRRDLIARDRELYNYILALEVAKALDSHGDQLSGFDKAAANHAWARSVAYRNQAQEIRERKQGT